MTDVFLGCVPSVSDFTVYIVWCLFDLSRRATLNTVYVCLYSQRQIETDLVIIARFFCTYF